ncbi:MAG: hypothetical protein HZC46_06390 [Ignavibacterium album]|uniref:hypothetical protein n=1 Tax=Ignavibacterium album TaxID=591197 RepID=UPI0026F11320|nr:hypothetical protein [Ignavibacterium album]MBI5661755.1 hypothetical protein [Ignavibacterium album]
MRICLFAFLILLSISLVWGQNNSKDIPKSPLTVADIESVFGKGFKEEAPSKFGESTSYRFSNKDYTIQILVEPSYGMKTISEYNKMMSPKGVTWKPISNDPDGAMIEVRDDKNDDLASNPAVEYIRKDKHIRLQVLGTYYGFDKKDMPKARDEMRTKLAKLKRIP